MPSQKKTSSDYWIAAIHYFFAGLIVPLLGGFVAEQLVQLALGMPQGAGAFASFIGSALGVYLGVMYSARRLNKMYAIRNGPRIANLATLYILVVVIGLSVLAIGPIFLGGIEGLYIASATSGLGTMMGPMTVLALILGSRILNMVVFYFASRFYIKSNVA